MFDSRNSISLLAFLALPSMLFLGWIIYLSWVLGIEGWWIVLLLLLVAIYVVFIFLKNVNWSNEDYRWLVAPSLVIVIAMYLPWWDYTQAWPDSSVHLFQSLNFIGFYEWIPPTGLGYRSPIIPGVISFQFLLNRSPENIFIIPIILFIASAWQIQHFTERYCSKRASVLCVCLFILLPTVRYWGQMAMTDVPVSGMWFFTMAIFIESEKDRMNEKLTFLLGISVGLLFLTKYTFIYMLGLICWFVLTNLSFKRTGIFLVGWILISLPFLLDQFFKYGNPIFPFTGQIHYAKVSTFSTVGTYDERSFLNDITPNLNYFLLFCSIIGMFLFGYRQKMDSKAILVMALPLLILNGFILDWGEPRYNIPLLGLGVILSMICLESEFNKPILKKIKWFPHICSIIILCSLMTHVASLSNEREEALVRNENFDVWSQFEIRPMTELNKSSLVLAGRSTSISLLTEIPTLRWSHPIGNTSYEPTGDYLSDSILRTEATHILTTNVAPRLPFEKLFNYQLGHPMIELQSVAIGDGTANAWWTSVLWEVNQTEYLQPDQVFSTHNGTLFGDLIVLAPNESFTVGEHNLSIKWVEVTSKRPDQQVLRILGGEIGLIQNGSIHNPDLASFSSGQHLTSPRDKYTYAWVESIL